jgi:hypothetical protein
MMLKTTVPAAMVRKSPRQIPKRSVGRRPTVDANDEIPDEASSGSKNNVLGTLASMNNGEVGSLI